MIEAEETRLRELVMVKITVVNGRSDRAAAKARKRQSRKAARLNRIAANELSKRARAVERQIAA